MSLPFFHKDHMDISNHLDFPSELLNLPTSSENCILVVGPDLVRREAAPVQGYTYTYLERLLEGMVEWCTQKKVIQEQNIVHDLHTLLHNGAFVPLGYRIEEYLATTQLKEQCLRTALYSHNQVRKIHCDLVRIPHRTYITTTYDTCIESAYAQVWHSKLSKFYLSSLAQVVESSQKKQPFILKLYGDLDEPNSIRIGHRLLTGLYAEDVREHLRKLFSETLSIFIGFDDADRDFAVLQSLVTDSYIVHQKHPTRSRELFDGITTKAGDQSSDDIVHESFPENLSPGLVIFPQSRDVGEQLEENLPPNTTLAEPIGITISKAIAKDSSDSKDSKRDYKNDSTTAQSSQSSFIPPEDTSNHSRQPTTKSQAGTLNIRLSREIFKDFFLLLDELNCRPREKIVTRRGRWCYDCVEVDRDEHWDLIYLPDEILTEPTPTDLLVINGLCGVFGRGAFLLVFHTAGIDLDVEIEQIITIDWFNNAEVTAKLVSLDRIKKIMKKDEDTRIELTKGLFARQK